MKRTYTDDFGDKLIVEQEGDTVFVMIAEKDDSANGLCVQLSPHNLRLVIDALLEIERRAKNAQGRR